MELLSYDDVAEMFGVDHSCVRRWVYGTDFPKPIKISYKVRKFDKADIVNWLEGKKDVQKSEREE